MKVYLDNCCFNRPYDDQSQLRVSLETQENREQFDYTKWRQNLFEDMSLEELNNAAADFAKKNPF